MATEEQIQYLPIDPIIPDSDQPRRFFGEESLEGLAASLKEVGQLEPIRVRRDGDRFVIVNGERRWRAAKRAGFTHVAVIIEERELCQEEVLQRQLIANCQHEHLTDGERTSAVQLLAERTGWNASTIAKKLGFSNATVTRLLALGKLPGEIRERVQAGDIPLSSAYELSKVEDPAEQERLASQVAAGRLTRDALAGAVKARRNGGPAPQRGTSRVVCKLASATVTVSAEDALDLETFVSILEELLGKARKARTQGIEVSTLAKMFRDQAKV
jgi:ParB family chromosome partitioning protein